MKKSVLVIGGLLLVVGATRLPVQELRDYFSITGGTVIVNSPVTNSSSAVGFLFNTTNSLITSGAKLATFGNGGETVYSFGADANFEVFTPTNLSFGAFTIYSPSHNEFSSMIVDDQTLFSPEFYMQKNGHVLMDFAPANPSGLPMYVFDTYASRTAGDLVQFKNNTTNVFQVGPFAQVIGSVNGNAMFDLIPNAPDGSTPYTLDTSLAHTSGNLLEVKNMGTNVIFVQNVGSLEIGRNVVSYWAPDDSDILAGVHDAAFGERTSSQFFMSAVNTAGINSPKADVRITAVQSDEGPTFVFEMRGDGTNGISSGISMQSSQGVLEFILDAPDRQETILNPLADATTTAYIFDTDNTHTSGNLAEFKNNSTNKVWLTFDGDVHAQNFIMESSALKTDTTSGHSGKVQVYDNDDATYRDVISFTNGNTPAITIGGASGTTTTLQGILKSSDGSSGLTTNITAGLVTFTIKNGLITAVSL